MGYKHVRNLFDHATRYGLNKSERLLWLAIAERADDAGVAWPSMDELMDRTGLETPKSVGNVFASLAKKGLEIRVPVGTDKRGRPIFAYAGHKTTYRLPWLTASGASETPDGEVHETVDHSGGEVHETMDHWAERSIISCSEVHETMDPNHQRTINSSSSSSDAAAAPHGEDEEDEEEKKISDKGKTRTPVADLGVEAAIRHIVDRGIGIDRDGARVIVDSITASMLKRGETVSFWDRYIRRFTDEQLHQRLTDAIRARVRGRIITNLPGCGECNPQRRLEDSEGNDLGPCPTCTPAARPAPSADTPAERIAQ